MLTTTARTIEDTGRAAPSACQAPCLRIGVGEKGWDVTLGTERAGCWAGMLGEFELPDADALDVVADAASIWDPMPERIELHGPPAACLLPLLWLRSIWLGPAATIDIVWRRVDAPGNDPREPLAARLCSGLANQVRCEDPQRAEELWGISPGPSRALGSEGFDLAMGLIDGWDIQRRTGFITDTGEWQVRMRDALESLAERGKKSIALYGAGTHTRAMGALFMSPPVEIACIIDDDPARQGRRLWGYRIASRDEAIELGVDAVILSANAHEPKLWANRAEFETAGVDVVRLYEDIDETDAGAIA